MVNRGFIRRKIIYILLSRLSVNKVCHKLFPRYY